MGGWVALVANLTELMEDDPLGCHTCKVRSASFRERTPQKSNIDTKKIAFFFRELPFPNHHFGYPAVSFRECR